jgi:hypothetical protein
LSRYIGRNLSILRYPALLLLAVSIFGSTAGAQTQWSQDFGDNEGWSAPQYAGTTMFADINKDGIADVCGRGINGIACALSTGHEFQPIYVASSDFSDSKGFNNASYYTSLRFGDVNGDGMPDICGRSKVSIVCVLGRGDGTFQTAENWSTDYGDAAGWGDLAYASTFMLGDINGDGRADMCTRGPAGIYCSLSLGNRFGSRQFSNSEFSDALGWSNPTYYGSIRMGDVDGDGRVDICGRGVAGIYCILSFGNGTFAPSRLWTSNNDFSDAALYGKPQYSSTMMLADINRDGKADVCMRSTSVGSCSVSTGAFFAPARLLFPSFFAGAAGTNWDAPQYYGSLRMADVSGDKRVDICGRGVAGIFCAIQGVVFY